MLKCHALSNWRPPALDSGDNVSDEIFCSFSAQNREMLLCAATAVQPPQALPNTVRCYLVKTAFLKLKITLSTLYMASWSQFVREFQQEVLDNMGERQLRHTASSATQLHDALPAQLLQRRLPFPVRDAQAFLWGVDVMLQEGEERREGALVARQ